ncbi:MAG TPA: SRPBCC family protein [Thermoanaerobaculia bacterium]|nr:SRPBCC family protein [Thermoanaerobaculia bacterium]
MSIFRSTREIPATPDQVFAAISDPQRLARWWGPAGFTNTFDVCEVRPGGRWEFVMHGPDGHNYPNESVFAEVDPPHKVVVDHVCEPKFRLTVTLAPSEGGTTVTWVQVFENAAFAGSVEHIVAPANEQNLDRWTAEVLREPVSPVW